MDGDLRYRNVAYRTEYGIVEPTLDECTILGVDMHSPLDECTILGVDMHSPFDKMQPMLMNKCELLEDLESLFVNTFHHILAKVGRLEMLECLRLKKTLPECLTANPHISNPRRNEYEENSTYKVKVLLNKEAISKLMQFIAKAGMESDRCNVCPQHNSVVDYALLQKTYNACQKKKQWLYNVCQKKSMINIVSSENA